MFVWIIGWELVERLILPHICCADFWLEKPINILGDIVVGLLGYIIGVKYFSNPKG